MGGQRASAESLHFRKCKTRGLGAQVGASMAHEPFSCPAMILALESVGLSTF